MVADCSNYSVELPEMKNERLGRKRCRRLKGRSWRWQVELLTQRVVREAVSLQNQVISVPVSGSVWWGPPALWRPFVPKSSSDYMLL